jgi:hypothetical protein
MDVSSLRTGDLMEYEKPKSVKDTALFLLTLVKGKASLYYQKDKDDREHFYVSKDDSIFTELLLKKSYIKPNDDQPLQKSYAVTVEIFKGQLFVLFNDCPDIKGAINNSEYSSSSLVKIVIKYNDCRHSTSEFVKKEEKTRVKFGIVAGPTLIKMSFSGGDSYLKGIKMKDCYSFMAGVSFHLIFPRERAQWSLVNELGYVPYSTSAITSGYSVTGESQDISVSFKMGYVKLYTLVRYLYPMGKFRPFAEFGMSNGYAFKCVNTKTEVSTFYSSVRTTTEPAIQDIRLYEFGLLGGIGVSWKKLSAAVRYEWAQGVSPLMYLKGPQYSSFFVLSFLF